MEEEYPVLKRDYPLNEKNLDFWVNDKESPYTEVKRFDWYRGYQVGGRSLMWGRQSYRWSDLDFEANAKEGIADRLADPLRRASRRGTTTSSGTPASPARARGCRSSPTASSSPPCRSTAARSSWPASCRSCSTDAGASSPGARRTHAAARGARRLPVPQRLLARLSVRRVLQHAVVHAARGGEDRAAHAQAVVDRHRGPVRQRPPSAPPACACSTRSPSRRPTTRRRSSSSARPRSTPPGS